MSETENSRKVLSLLGLCQRAGKLKSGEQACETAVSSREAVLVVLSQDAAPWTVKKFTQKCHYYQIPVAVLPCTKEEVGRALGKGYRSCAAVCEAGFARSISGLTEKLDV